MAAAKSDVTSNAATKPRGRPRKREQPDERMMGYVFPFPANKDNVPFDFRFDMEKGECATGTRVWGCQYDDLRSGIEGATLPPVSIWKKGRWLKEFEDAPIRHLFRQADKATPDELAYACWVVSGEGTPGAYFFRCYLIPSPYVNEEFPKHPMVWKLPFKTGAAGKFSATMDQRWTQKIAEGVNERIARFLASWDLLQKGFVDEGEDSPWSFLKSPPYSPPSGPTGPPYYPATVHATAAPKAVTVPAPTKPYMPPGVKFRCSGCGHWFSESGFLAHSKAKICPGLTDEGEADFAVMCDKECGCMTLHDVGTCKPGFPRETKTKEVTMSTVEEDKPVEQEPTETEPKETPEAEPEPAEPTPETQTES